MNESAMNSFFEMLKYTIPSIIALIAAYYIVQKFLVSELERKKLALFNESKAITLPLRLQAYERLTIFLERIQPRTLIPRLYDPSMNVAIFRQILTQNIQSEFEHNLSQQIYVSREVWETVRGAKEQELNMIHNIASQLNADAPAKELHERISSYLIGVDGQLPGEIAIYTLSDEAKMVLRNA